MASSSLRAIFYLPVDLWIIGSKDPLLPAISKSSSSGGYEKAAERRKDAVAAFAGLVAELRAMAILGQAPGEIGYVGRRIGGPGAEKAALESALAFLRSEIFSPNARLRVDYITAVDRFSDRA